VAAPIAHADMTEPVSFTEGMVRGNVQARELATMPRTVATVAVLLHAAAWSSLKPPSADQAPIGRVRDIAAAVALLREGAGLWGTRMCSADAPPSQAGHPDAQSGFSAGLSSAAIPFGSASHASGAAGQPISPMGPTLGRRQQPSLQRDRLLCALGSDVVLSIAAAIWAVERRRQEASVSVMGFPRLGKSTMSESDVPSRSSGRSGDGFAGPAVVRVAAAVGGATRHGTLVGMAALASGPEQALEVRGDVGRCLGQAAVGLWARVEWAAPLPREVDLEDVFAALAPLLGSGWMVVARGAPGRPLTLELLQGRGPADDAPASSAVSFGPAGGAAAVEIAARVSDSDDGVAAGGTGTESPAAGQIVTGLAGSTTLSPGRTTSSGRRSLRKVATAGVMPSPVVSTSSSHASGVLSARTREERRVRRFRRNAARSGSVDQGAGSVASASERQWPPGSVWCVDDSAAMLQRSVRLAAVVLRIPVRSVVSLSDGTEAVERIRGVLAARTPAHAAGGAYAAGIPGAVPPAGAPLSTVGEGPSAAGVSPGPSEEQDRASPFQYAGPAREQAPSMVAVGSVEIPSSPCPPHSPDQPEPSAGPGGAAPAQAVTAFGPEVPPTFGELLRGAIPSPTTSGPLNQSPHPSAASRAAAGAGPHGGTAVWGHRAAVQDSPGHAAWATPGGSSAGGTRTSVSDASQDGAAADDGSALLPEEAMVLPRVIITDLHMPGMTGVDAVSRILAMWPRGEPRPAVVAVTSETSGSLRERADALLPPGCVVMKASTSQIADLRAALGAAGVRLPPPSTAAVSGRRPLSTGVSPKPRGPLDGRGRSALPPSRGRAPGRGGAVPVTLSGSVIRSQRARTTDGLPKRPPLKP